MSKAKYLGIWMDHSTANLMEYSSDTIETKTIHSTFTHQDKEFSLSKSEFQMHNREQHEQASYYKALSEVIINYDAVILFGPTDAKVELSKIIKRNHLFDDIKIEVETTDKMTQNQQHAFVKNYFEQGGNSHIFAKVV